MQDSLFRMSRWIILLLVSLSLTTLIGCSSRQLDKAPETLKSLSVETLRALDPQPPAPVVTPALQPTPAIMPPASGMRSLAAGDPLSVNPDTVELKLLIIAAKRLDETGTETESSLASWEAFLDQVGAPYQTLIATEEELTPGFLVTDDGVGRFYGILLVSNGLPYYDSIANNWPSAFSPEEWELLFQYEREFNVREVSLYTNPNPEPLIPTWPEDFDGLTAKDWGSNAPAGYFVHLTDEGKNIFPYINGSVGIPIVPGTAYLYRSYFPDGAGTSAIPILRDTENNIMGVISTSTDARERLALTFAHHPSLLHTQLLGYGLIDWVTKGVFIGERRQYLAADIDDWFMATDRWDLEEAEIIDDGFHLSARDAWGLRNQQNTLRGQYRGVAAEFTWTPAFNGVGAVLTAPEDCNPELPGSSGLSSMTKCVAGDFYWYNHTWSHDYMDSGAGYSMDYAGAFFQINENDKIVGAFGFGSRYSPHSLITGDVSGLGWYAPGGPNAGPKEDRGLEYSNPEFLQAAKDTGRIYVASNMSTKSHEPDCTGCGIWHPMEGSILLVPRWPTNVFASVTTAEAATQAYNMVYGPGGTAPYYPNNLTFSQYLDAEAAIALRHVLSGSPYPHYFHVANAHEYQPGHSLLYDWADRVVETYSRYLNLPLLSLQWDDLGALVADRTSFRNAGMSGTWNRSTSMLTIHSVNAGTLFMTGVNVGTSIQYGPELISWRSMGSNETSVFPVSGVQPDVFYQLALSSSEDGGITANRSGPYLADSSVVLTATANPGWQFSRWTGDLNGSTNPASILMNTDKTIGAEFTQITYQITTSNSTSGTITLNPPGPTYPAGTQITATATPTDNWLFSSWTGGLTGSSNPHVFEATSSMSISAVFTQRPPETYNLSVSSATGGSISPGSGTHAAQSTLSLTATANPGWQFSRWTGDLNGSTNPASILMNTDKTIGAEFTQITYQITTSANGSGSIRLQPEAASYTLGQSVTATATANSGSQFSGWTGVPGNGNPLTFEVTGNMSITATFIPTPPVVHDLTINTSEGGSITADPSGPYPAGSTAHLTATANPGWQLSRWTGDLNGSTNPASILMNTDKTIGAEFIRKPVTPPPPPPRPVRLTIRAAGLGSGSIAGTSGEVDCLSRLCSVEFTKGSTVTLRATPAPGATFAGWSGACRGTGDCTVVMNRSQAVTARFEPPPPPVLIAVVTLGSGSVTSSPAGINCSPTCIAMMDRSAGTVTLTARPATGYTFSGWSGDCRASSATCTIELNRSRLVLAQFVRKGR